jgi:hypothetical protein
VRRKTATNRPKNTTLPPCCAKSELSKFDPPRVHTREGAVIAPRGCSRTGGPTKYPDVIATNRAMAAATIHDRNVQTVRRTSKDRSGDEGGFLQEPGFPCFRERRYAATISSNRAWRSAWRLASTSSFSGRRFRCIEGWALIGIGLRAALIQGERKRVGRWAMTQHGPRLLNSRAHTHTVVEAVYRTKEPSDPPLWPSRNRARRAREPDT